MKYLYVTYSYRTGNKFGCGDFLCECDMIDIIDMKKHASKLSGVDIETITISFSDISKEEHNFNLNKFNKFNAN